MSYYSKSQANLTLRPTSPERLTTQLRWAFCWRAPSGDGHPDHWFERLRRRRAPPRKMQSASGGIVCEQSRGLFLLLIKFFLLGSTGWAVSKSILLFQAQRRQQAM